MNREIKREDLALELACMLGHQNADSYEDGLRNTIKEYEKLTGDKQFNNVFKKKWYKFWFK